MEEPPCRGPHLVPRGRGQPVPPVPACRRLLAVVVAAPADAAALLVARHAVRHPTVTLDQDRRAGCRTEEADQDPPAVERPRPEHLPSRPQPLAAPGHLTHGACAPPNPSSSPPKTTTAARLPRIDAPSNLNASINSTARYRCPPNA